MSSESQTFLRDILKTQDGILQRILTSQITQSQKILAQIADEDKFIRSLQVGLSDRDRLIADRDRVIREREQALQSVFNSKSWALTKPFRFMSEQYQKIKQRLFQD